MWTLERELGVRDGQATVKLVMPLSETDLTTVAQNMVVNAGAPRARCSTPAEHAALNMPFRSAERVRGYR